MESLFDYLLLSRLTRSVYGYFYGNQDPAKTEKKTLFPVFLCWRPRSESIALRIHPSGTTPDVAYRSIRVLSSSHLSLAVVLARSLRCPLTPRPGWTVQLIHCP